jgi:hypothetical protein
MGHPEHHLFWVAEIIQSDFSIDQKKIRYAQEQPSDFNSLYNDQLGKCAIIYTAARRANIFIWNSQWQESVGE